MKQLFKTKIGITPIEQAVFFQDGLVKQIDNHGVYMDKTDIKGQFTISKFEFEKLKSIFNKPEVEIKGNEVIFKENKNKVILKQVNHTDVTDNYLIINEDVVKTLPENFYEVMVKASNYASDNDKRVILNGVNINNGAIRATNSFKAYKANMDIDLPEINVPKALISNLNGMSKYVVVKSEQDDYKVVFANKDLSKQILLREYEGVFPNLDGFIDNIVDFKKIDVNKPELEEALDIALKLGVDQVKITHNKIESKNSNIAFEMEIMFGVDFEIILNTRMLKDAFVNGEVFVKGSLERIISQNQHEKSLVLPLRV